MTDLNLFMQGMRQQKMVEARGRLREMLAEAGMRITVIEWGARIVLTDDKSGKYLDLDDGTWH